MKRKLILCALVLMGHAAFAFADITFENKTQSLVGVRIQNLDTREDKHTLLRPGEIYTHTDTPAGVITSTQVITGSYVVNCCEWLSVQDNKTVVIGEVGKSSENCRCEIQ